MTIRDRDLARMLSRPVSRRSALAAMGLFGGSAALAACGTGGTGSGTPSASAAPSASAGGSAAPSTSAAPAANVEKELFMYNWSDYTSPDNIERFKQEFGVDNFVYDTYANNEELIAKLQAGASGYDIAAPTAEYVPGMVEEGFLAKLDLSRIPNQKHINPAFKGLWWDPTDEYQLPKDFGTTGILYRGKLVQQPPTSWREFKDLITGEFSGRVVFVDSMGDVMVFPLKMLGYSLNSVDQAELEEARQVLLEVAPHVLALDSDLYQDKMRSEEAALVLGWTGPLVELRADAETADSAYVIPSEGTLFWLDTWVMMSDAPHPNAAYAFLNFIHEPDVQAEETNFNGYGSPNDAAKEFITPEILNDPVYFPPEETMKNLEGAEDTSGNNQRLDIWQEFKSKIGS